MLRRSIYVALLIVMFVTMSGTFAISSDKIKISGIEVQGNSRISKDEIIKLLELPDEVDEEILKAGLQKLIDTGYFYNVDTSIKVVDNKYILVLNVVELPAFKGVEVTGNREISTDEIKNLISLKPGDAINLTILRSDLEKIANLYKERGYVGANFQFSMTADGLVTVNINEGPVVSDFEFKGNEVLKSEELGKELDKYKGRTLSINLLKEMVTCIQELYNKNGYPACVILNAYSNDSGVVTFEIGEGKISKIEIKGNNKTKDYVILREMETKVGSVLNADKLQKDLQKIFNLGYFSDIKADIHASETPGEIILTIEVVEQLTGQANGGLAYSTRDGLSLLLGISDSNLLGTGRKLGLSLNIGLTARDISLNYTEPYIFGDLSTLDCLLISRQAENSDIIGTSTVKYNEDRKTLDLTLSRPIDSNLRGTVGVSCNDIIYSPDEDGTTLPDILQSGLSNAILLGVARDTRDVVFNPTKGDYYGTSIKFGGGILGGDFSFTKLTLDMRWYKPVTDKETVAINYTWNFGSGNLPYIEKSSVGGVNSVRGLPENWKKSDNTEILSFEYRIKIQENVSGVVFLDFGNGWDSDETINPTDLYTGIGLGLRIPLPPMGILRLDYGWGSYDWQGRFYFSIGHKF
ncbi:MAG: BamA/TamA family outer membrane protein [Dictyoglomi bacterium]|nr:BamA/TamA family outer membrane protein [Dictyoglomota bacterium]HHV80442.1 BamA/TamA family outer membrane protein [bacterium]HOK29343.1 BamA/TamA family outer membrane protein [bacterium]HOL54696.1 BamA/TamA family outer membrane protein [bacterium]